MAENAAALADNQGCKAAYEKPEEYQTAFKAYIESVKAKQAVETENPIWPKRLTISN